MDLIIIFLAKNGKLFLDHTDPLNRLAFYLGMILKNRGNLSPQSG